ncbi:MAG: ATP-binding cassette domain-containing protein [Proteobacteria bacterium]|nr:ATP-binding cassette domain-containing protein [Pseudomonadota bacterium]
MTAADKTSSATKIVDVVDVYKHYPLPRESLFTKPGVVQAVDGVSLSIVEGRSFGLVGESGCGKSTLARLVMALEPPTSGKVLFRGDDLNALSVNDLRQRRSDFQMVFQDPFGSLDPRQKVERIVAEPLAGLGAATADQRRPRVVEVLEAVGLKSSDLGKYPHEFSGGQRQRIAIARALITRPALIVADESVSALDVSVQAQVLNLMQDLQAEFGVTYLFISHDLAVVEYVCADVAVMNAGKIVERGVTTEIFANPQHPYTRTLLDAVPKMPELSR